MPGANTSLRKSRTSDARASEHWKSLAKWRQGLLEIVQEFKNGRKSSYCQIVRHGVASLTKLLVPLVRLPSFDRFFLLHIRLEKSILNSSDASDGISDGQDASPYDQDGN